MGCSTLMAESGSPELDSSGIDTSTHPEMNDFSDFEILLKAVESEPEYDVIEVPEGGSALLFGIGGLLLLLRRRRRDPNA